MNKKILIGVIILIVVACFAYRLRTKDAEPGFQYFGNEAVGDLNGDGKDDKAYLVTKTSGESIAYYAVVELQTSNGSEKTNPFFIGNDIAPQSTYIPKNSMELQVNYAERKPGDPLSVQPSVGAVKLLKVNSSGVLEGLMK